MHSKKKIHYQACNLCEAICGLEIETRGREILSIKGDKNDPLSLGHICPKAIALQDIYSDPDRLRQPVRKTAQGWEAISWSQAFTEVVQALQKVQQRFGRDAVGVYQGNPSVHSLGIMLYAHTFFKCLQTRNRFSATSVDQLPLHIAAGLMFGHEMLIPIPDIDRTQCMIILGANPLVSNGSMMTVPAVGKRLKALQARGGKFWVIDPRRTETAELADEHFFIHPGTDAHLLAAMITTVFQENLQKTTHVTALLDGVHDLAEMLAPWTPESTEARTGIPAQTLRRMVREFCAAESAVLYGRMGVSTQIFGTLCQWMLIVFNILTGNFDKSGGAMFATPAIDLLAARKHRAQGKSAFSFDRFRSRVKNLPEMQGELPVTTLADELLTPGEGQIRAMVLLAGNPVLSTPNGQRLAQAFEQLEFVVAVDAYINESTRHANIILPPSTMFERDHYDLVFHTFAVRNTARFSKALFPSEKTLRSDAQILLELAARLQHPKGKISLLKYVQLKYFTHLELRRRVDSALKSGPYAASHNLTLDTLLKADHGVDLGPLVPSLPQRLFTADKRIDIAPDKIIEDLPRLQQQLVNAQVDKDFSTANMLLIGRRDPRTCNSWLHNSERMTKGKERCVAHIHPVDVAKLNLQVDLPVRVSSQTGEIEIAFVATDTIKPGVISIPHGWGHNVPGVKISCAVEHAGVSVNNITDTEQFDAVSGNAILNGVSVKVEQAYSG